VYKSTMNPISMHDMVTGPNHIHPKNYYTEFGEVIQALEEDERITRVNRMLVGLSLASAD